VLLLPPINSMITDAFFRRQIAMLRINWRLNAARDGEWMADFRFIIGALLAVVVSGSPCSACWWRGD
jgi:hypothetical protein